MFLHTFVLYAYICTTLWKCLFYFDDVTHTMIVYKCWMCLLYLDHFTFTVIMFVLYTLNVPVCDLSFTLQTYCFITLWMCLPVVCHLYYKHTVLPHFECVHCTSLNGNTLQSMISVALWSKLVSEATVWIRHTIVWMYLFQCEVWKEADVCQLLGRTQKSPAIRPVDSTVASFRVGITLFVHEELYFHQKFSPNKC